MSSRRGPQIAENNFFYKSLHRMFSYERRSMQNRLENSISDSLHRLIKEKALRSDYNLRHFS
jgi:hypothetical protein